MPKRDKWGYKSIGDLPVTPFHTAEEAWFWFIEANAAQMNGARMAANTGIYRPCEPADIFTALNRLYRQRIIVWEQILILKHFGERRMAPDRHHHKEARAADMWSKALGHLENTLVSKSIVLRPKGHSHWIRDMAVYENTDARP